MPALQGMRGIAWLLGLIGVIQFGILAYLRPSGYVSLDMAYLVMWLLILAGVAVYCCSWCASGCYGWNGDSCDCCGDNCGCGDCGECCEDDDEEHEHGEAGHEGHSH